MKNELNNWLYKIDGNFFKRDGNIIVAHNCEMKVCDNHFLVSFPDAPDILKLTPYEGRDTMLHELVVTSAGQLTKPLEELLFNIPFIMKPVYRTADYTGIQPDSWGLLFGFNHFPNYILEAVSQKMVKEGMSDYTGHSSHRRLSVLHTNGVMLRAGIGSFHALPCHENGEYTGDDYKIGGVPLTLNGKIHLSVYSVNSIPNYENNNGYMGEHPDRFYKFLDALNIKILHDIPTA